MTALVFQVEQEADGGFVAEAIGEAIVTQGDNWQELCENVRDACRGISLIRSLLNNLF